MLWQFVPEVTLQRRKEIVEELDKRFKAMVGPVEGLAKAEVGLNTAGDSPYHMALYTEFTSRTALDNYQTHPLHMAIKRDMKDLLCGRLLMDYEV